MLAGLWALVRSALGAMGGYERLWLFGGLPQSRFTSMAMLTGTLRLRGGLAHVGHDEQVFNGAAYTNWGFGVPLLELPFHAVARHLARYPSKFFPDRAIYFFYLLLLLPLLWAAFDKLLARRGQGGGSRLGRHALSWSATLLVLTCALYPVMSCRFLIYEETVAYLTVFELLAVSAYVFARDSWSAPSVAAIAAAAGMGLLIRPTGFGYMGVWGLLVLLEARRARPVAVFAAAAAPFVGFWLYSNWVRSGSPVSFGLGNSLPWFPYHTPLLRFGSRCADTAGHALETATLLFRGFFVTLNDPPAPLPPLYGAAPLPPPDPWTKRCHFEWEARSPDAQSFHLDPFLGIAVLGVLVWILARHLARRDRRPAVYVPFLAMAVMFAGYVASAAGFSWRYAADFWPLIVLAAVHHVRALRPEANRALGLPLALALGATSVACYARTIEPAVSTLDMYDPNGPKTTPAAMWDDFEKARNDKDGALPSRYKCGDPAPWPFHNGQGWKADCTVDTFTNLFLGIPAKGRDYRYLLKLTTTGMSASTLRVYVNGGIYTAQRDGEGYWLVVPIHRERFTSPIVMTTIEWTRELEPQGGRLLSVELS